MAKVNLKHSGAVIDQQIDRVIDGSVVVDNTLSALDLKSNKPVDSEGISSAIEAASNSLKARGYIYMGVATPTTTPDVSGGKVFYLAAQAGEYTNFGYTLPTDALTSLEWNGERWFAVRIADLVTPAEVEQILAPTKDFADALKSTVEGDNVRLPIPRVCAKVNIISETGLATTKTDNKKCIIEYFDKDGNYLKRYAILNAQGDSSMLYIEKNQTCDLYEDVSCTVPSKVKFGKWVAQESFHFKCYYIDVFRGICNIGYNIVENSIQLLGCRNSRKVDATDATTMMNGTGVFDADFGTGALCHPDGFPFEMFVNGEYYGLYVWNLKKHRDNYNMNKHNSQHIILDGEIGQTELFGGTVDWSSFEIRNPKGLITMDGSEYDGDNPAELIDESSSSYVSTNPSHLRSLQTKQYIERLSGAIQDIEAIEDITLARKKMEEYFDVPSLLLYWIITFVVYHIDGVWKNWIWLIYNGVASPSFYDMDSIFGRHWNGTYVIDGSQYAVFPADVIAAPMYSMINRLCREEMCSMYAELRDNEVISTKSIMAEVYKWIERVGTEAYKRNLDKWNNIPSYRTTKSLEDGTAEGGMFDSPLRVAKWVETRMPMVDKFFGYVSTDDMNILYVKKN